MQLQQYKQGTIPSNVPALEDKPKENGQVDSGDQVTNTNNKVNIMLIPLEHDCFAFSHIAILLFLLRLFIIENDALVFL